jgi:hypothetical protein
MPRKRTSSLVFKPLGFFARVSIGPRRKVIDLGTTDVATARRKLASLVGELEKKVAMP